MGSPRFSHLDDLKWQEVRRMRQGDRTMSVREKWLDFSPAFLSLYAKWDAGMIVQPHGHNSNHVVFVLEGEMTCGDVVCRKGSHIALDHGDTFGPFVAGADGVELFEVMMGDPRSFAADPEGYAKFLADRGAEQMPNPPIDMPDWIQDTRELIAMARHIYRFADIDWHVPHGPGTDPDVAQAAADVGVGRKFLAQGDAGFYAQVVRFPAHFEAPAHSHDHAEVFVVLDGSCTFDGEPMARHDSTVVEANQSYGFTAGADGLAFLVVRTGKAAFAAGA